MSARTVKEPEERRAEILEAARRMFGEKGYDATSVSDIVKSLGVSQGTFYWYFKSKEEAFHEIAHLYADERMTDVAAIVNRDDLSALEKIKAVFGSFTARDEGERELVERVHTPGEHALHDHMVREVANRIIPLLAALIEQGVEEGVFVTSYPAEAAAFMIAMGSVQDFVDTTELTEADRERWIKAYIEFMSKGLGYSGDSMEEISELPGLSTTML